MAMAVEIKPGGEAEGTLSMVPRSLKVTPRLGEPAEVETAGGAVIEGSGAGA